MGKIAESIKGANSYSKEEFKEITKRNLKEKEEEEIRKNQEEFHKKSRTWEAIEGIQAIEEIKKEALEYKEQRDRIKREKELASRNIPKRIIKGIKELPKPIKYGFVGGLIALAGVAAYKVGPDYAHACYEKSMQAVKNEIIKDNNLSPDAKIVIRDDSTSMSSVSEHVNFTVTIDEKVYELNKIYEGGTLIEEYNSIYNQDLVDAIEIVGNAQHPRPIICLADGFKAQCLASDIKNGKKDFKIGKDKEKEDKEKEEELSR